MPGNIRDPWGRATSTGPDAVTALRDQVGQLAQQVAHLSGMLQQQATRPNPAPPSGTSDHLLLQLLLAERERSDNMHAQLVEASDPVAKIEALAALADMMPAAENPDQPDMLKTALMGLGSVLVENMGSGVESPGGETPTLHDEATSAVLEREPDHPFHVAFDSGPGPGTPPGGDLDVGEGEPPLPTGGTTGGGFVP